MPLSERDRARIAMKPRNTKRQITVGIICLLLGFVTVSSAQSNGTADALATARESDLVAILDDVSQRRDRLERETRELTSAREQLLSGSAEQVIAQTRERVRALSVLAGTVPVFGPGVVIQLSDPQGVLGADILLNTVQELRDAGAEAIAVNGRRVVVNTWFEDGRSRGINVSGAIIRPPYTITVIGDANALAPALRIPGGIADAVRASGARFALSAVENVTIDAVVQPSKPRYAAPTS